MSSIDYVVEHLDKNFKLYVSNSFRLSDDKYFHVLYFRDKPNNPNQLKLFSEDYLNSLRVDNYEKK